MNKILLLLSVLIILTFNQIFAQCNPTPFAGPELAYPDTSVGIAIAAETQYYEQVIVIRIPADTVYLGAVITIDSAGLNTVSGLPSTMSWATNSDNDFWPGDTYGCIVFQGTPAIGDAGIHKLQLSVSINALGTSMPYIIEYELEVLDAAYAGVNQASDLSFKVLQNQPNPFDNYTQINYNMPKAGNVDFSVYDILGNKVVMKEYSSIKGQNSINFYKENLANGIYIYELRHGESIIRKKMVIR